MKIFGEKKTYEVINIYLEIQRKKSHINFGVYQELFFSPFSFESHVFLFQITFSLYYAFY